MSALVRPRLPIWLTVAAILVTSALVVPASGLAGEGVDFEEKLLVKVPSDVEIWRQGVFDKHLSDIDRFGFPFYSSDGKTVSYIGTRDGLMFASINGEESEAYDMVRFLVHSGDGKHVAFQGSEDGKWCVVIDGKATPFYKDATEVIFSEKNDRIAYRYQDGDQWHLILDGKEVGSYFFVDRIVLSPNGKRLSFLVNTGKGMVFNVVDGRRVGAEWDRVIGSPVFSADSKSMAYIADGRNRQWMVVDGQPRKRYRKVEHPMFVGNKNQLCFIATQGKSKRLVVAGTEFPRFSWVSRPFFGKKARQPRYVIRERTGDFKVMVGEKILKEHGKGGKDPRRLKWSKDGKRFAYIATNDKGQHCVYHVDKALPGFAQLHPELFLSDDGKTVGYVAENDEKKCFVILNDRVSEPYDDVFPEIHFDEKGKKAAYCARKGREIWWKVVEL